MSKFKTTDINHAVSSMTNTICANHIIQLNDIENNAKKALKRKTFSLYMQNTKNFAPTHTKFAQELISFTTRMQGCPFINGQLIGCKLHPLLEAFTEVMLPLRNINPYLIIDEIMIKNHFDHFQYLTQTKALNMAISAWDKSSIESEKSFNNLVKNCFKKVKGIEMLEFTLNYPINNLSPFLRLSMQDVYIHPEQIKSIIDEVHKAEASHLIAITSKLEMTIYNQLKLRIMIFIKRDFIEDPAGFKDKNLFQRLKNKFEMNSENTITYEMLPLNGYMNSNKFYTQLPDFSNQIKLLKTYLIGTETLVRIGGSNPSFKIWYSKDQNSSEVFS